MKILITAFEAFNNDISNSSLEVLNLINRNNIIKEVLPVSYKRCKEEIYKLCDIHKPDLVICLGQASGEKKIRVEKVALNYTRAKISDNDGVILKNGKVVDDENLALFTKINVEKIVDDLNDDLIVLSLSAGSYICNSTYYCALKKMNGKALFIHLPNFFGQVNDSFSLPLNKMKDVVSSIIDYIEVNENEIL